MIVIDFQAFALTFADFLPAKTNKKTRKKREELSVFASKSIKKEKIKIIVEFK